MRNKARGLVVPIVAAVVSLIVFLSLSAGTNYLMIAQNNQSQSRLEQIVIQQDIQHNNQTLCDIVVTSNKAVDSLTPAQKKKLNELQTRIIHDYRVLAVEYKCSG